jgi:DNA-binding transcriptional ArsR family regulator
MGYTLIAPVGEDWENIYIGIREFPIRKIIFISSGENLAIVAKAKKDLEKFRIPVEVIQIRGDMFEEFFKIIRGIKKQEGGDNILINVASGDKVSACVALSAAFVNGIKAFGVMDGNPMLFPVLKFSYYKLISEKKMKILEALGGNSLSLVELSSATKMSPSLISYHIHGSSKTDGLLSLGLVELMEEEGTKVKLSTLGRMLLNAYV